MVLSAVKSVPVVMAADRTLPIVHLLAYHAGMKVTTSAWNRVLLHLRHGREVVLQRRVDSM